MALFDAKIKGNKALSIEERAKTCQKSGKSANDATPIWKYQKKALPLRSKSISYRHGQNFYTTENGCHQTAYAGMRTDGLLVMRLGRRAGICKPHTALRLFRPGRMPRRKHVFDDFFIIQQRAGTADFGIYRSGALGYCRCRHPIPLAGL